MALTEAPSAADQPAAHMAAVHGHGLARRHPVQGEQRLGIARPEGGQALEILEQVPAGRAAVDQGVDLDRVRPRPPPARRPAALQEGAQLRRCGRAATVRPAAMAWPPPGQQQPASQAACTARPRFTPGCDRPEPLPTPVAGSTPMTTTGLRQRSRSRPATMPTTPGCQSSPATTMHGAVRRIGARLSTLRDGGLGHLALHLAAGRVQGVQLGGECARPRRDRRWTAGARPGPSGRCARRR